MALLLISAWAGSANLYAQKTPITSADQLARRTYEVNSLELLPILRPF
ncbi:hypothetical protein [Aureicoccus marinus]|nr:hypothetical protein [Aureicoccus marinus]